MILRAVCGDGQDRFTNSFGIDHLISQGSPLRLLFCVDGDLTVEAVLRIHLLPIVRLRRIILFVCYSIKMEI